MGMFLYDFFRCHIIDFPTEGGFVCQTNLSLKNARGLNIHLVKILYLDYNE